MCGLVLTAVFSVVPCYCPLVLALTVRCVVSGGLWRPDVQRGGKWQGVPGRHCQLGGRLCQEEQARRLHQGLQVPGVDQGTHWIVDVDSLQPGYPNIIPSRSSGVELTLALDLLHTRPTCR